MCTACARSHSLNLPNMRFSTKYFRFFIHFDALVKHFMVPLESFMIFFGFIFDHVEGNISVFFFRSLLLLLFDSYVVFHFGSRRLPYRIVCVRKPFYKIYVRLAYQKISMLHFSAVHLMRLQRTL